MADDLPTSDAFGVLVPESGEHPVKQDEGSDFEFDTAGMEPGLELDMSGLEPEPPEPQPDSPTNQPVRNPSPSSGPPPPAPRPPPPLQPGPRPDSDVSPGLPAWARAVAIGVAALFIVVLAATLLSDSEPPPNPIPQQALEEGEGALHQGKWVDALKAFKRLRRFPNSAEAQAVRDRGLEEKAFNEIMEAKPSSATVRRLEALSELYPERVEVRDRLGEVRKALSSGARGAPADGKD